MSNLLLNCIAIGDSTTFSVEIPSTALLHNLQEVIKNALGLTMPAFYLSLWRVSIPVAASKEQMDSVFNELNEDNKNGNPLEPLLALFPQGAPQDVVHFVVRRGGK